MTSRPTPASGEPTLAEVTPLHDPEQLPLAREDVRTTQVTPFVAPPSSARSDLDAVAELAEAHAQILHEIEKRIIGQRKVVEQLLVALFARGHTLFVGVPGLAKTLLISTLAETLNLSFQRIQFTPDLMPADITGTEVLEEDHTTGRRIFRFIKGPVFANLVLADEINRTPPKTQAALLQSMQEFKVTAGGHTHDLPLPFLVFATQNPIEQEGTYPLPEAQLDRFLFKIGVEYPGRDQEIDMVRIHSARMAEAGIDAGAIEPIADLETIEAARAVVSGLRMSDELVAYVVDIVRATREQPGLQFGASPRTANMLAAAARAAATMEGRDYVIPDDVKGLLGPVMRHRVLLSPAAEVEGLTAEEVLARILDTVPAPR